MRISLRLLTAALLGALTLVSPAASASSDSEFAGGCGFDAVADGTGVFRGHIYVAAAVYSRGTPAANPVAATITCQLTVNFVPQPGARLTVPGIGVVAGNGVMTYAARAYDAVHFCTEVDYTSDDTPTHTECEEIRGGPPPPEWGELVHQLQRLAEDVVRPLVGAVCFTADVDGVCPD